ncbi:hypothetical protein ACHAWF_012571 [Thalassiosira exigua]
MLNLWARCLLAEIRASRYGDEKAKQRRERIIASLPIFRRVYPTARPESVAT